MDSKSLKLPGSVFSTIILLSIAGYYQTAGFFIDDKEVLRIMTYENFIDINGTRYNMVKNKLSLKKIDDFINSIKANEWIKNFYFRRL